jgi:hypothetical protein
MPSPRSIEAGAARQERRLEANRGRLWSLAMAMLGFSGDRYYRRGSFLLAL